MTRGVVLISCCLLCGATLAETKEQNNPSLEETVKWMTSFSEVHGELYRGNTVVFTNRITGSGCKLDLVTNHPKPTAKGAKNVVSELNLGDFDPRVKIDGDDDQNEYEVQLERTDAQMKTHEMMEYSDGQKLEMWTAQIDVFFDSKESADGLQKQYLMRSRFAAAMPLLFERNLWHSPKISSRSWMRTLRSTGNIFGRRL